MPEDEVMKDYKRPFRVYWNVPTVQCKSKKVPFDNLYEKYGIIQNDGDNFRGEKITIMYEPGSFPAIFKNETSGKYRFRNGGVPQEGNLDDHLKVFREDMEEIIPDPNFDVKVEKRSKIREQVTTSSNPKPLSEPLMHENLILELKDRVEREKNLIIVGIAEKNDKKLNARRTYDDSEVIKLLTIVSKDVPKPIKCMRLGKYVPNKNRPIKVYFSNSETPKQLLRHKRNLPQNIQMYNDQTPKQKQYIQSLKNELQTRQESDEQDLIIKYIKGIGIIDFESWRPIFRQNFGTLVPYKDVSYEIERKLHWWWPKSWIHTEATQRFETAARQFMQTTLSIAKQMRPKASWGYYGFPHCFNMAGSSLNENCSPQVLAENDLLYWMWSESSALYPSVYSSRNLTTSQLSSLVRGRVKEANRVRRNNSPVLPYYWFRYREGGYMKEEDLDVVLKTFYKSNASGFIIWGSSNDVNTLNKCKNLYSYVETILGPTVAKYIKKINIANDVMIETPPELAVDNETVTTMDVVNKTNIVETENNTSTVKIGIDPEFEWTPPLNYTQDISRNVEEELIKKGYNKADEIIDIKTLNDSTVVDMIFDALINSNKNDARDDSKETNRGVQNETAYSSINKNLIVTEAPIIKDLDTLNSLITKDPLGFIEKLAIEEKNVGFLDDPLTTKEPIKNKELVDRITNAPVDNYLFFKENQVISKTDSLFNEDVTITVKNIDSTTLRNEIPEEKQSNIEENTVPVDNKDNFIDIFDALLNANYKREDENSNEYINSAQNELTTLTADTEYTRTRTKQNNLTNKNELENITTDDGLSNFDESYTETSIKNEKYLQGLFIETKPTIEINISETTENNLQVTPSSAKDVFSDQTDFNQGIDEFLLVITNTTDDSLSNVESSTQYYENTAFDNNEDNLIILAINLTNQSISENYLKTNEQTTESSDMNTLSDSVVMDNKNEFIVNTNKQESLSEINESLTTDATDQVKVPSSFASGSDTKSIYLYMYSTFIFFNNIFINNMP
ncbi:unnamed protein product [Euphydryas editha]|uniref:Hyaluronidase n=1 Tax=Euphydryas editha TaxID=104508 RepID=A0AAU9UNU9_EUPED|nr:unnamed protein product [Euphydryas editha]